MTTTTTADLVASAWQLQSLLREHSAAGDSAGELAGDVVDALHEHGMFGMWVPEPLGGAELDPLSSLRVIQTLAEADPSTAWVVMAASLATGTGGAYLADEAVAEMFGGDRFPVVAGQGTRPGTAVRDGDGYRLSGSWSFASGIKHAQWIHTLGIVEETGQPLIFVLPVERAELVDNWDVLGLRATGSIDYVIDDVYVPSGFTHFGPAEKGKRGGSLFHLGIMHFALICHSGWALGVSPADARRIVGAGPGQVRPSGNSGGQQRVPHAVRRSGGEVARRTGVHRRHLARRRRHDRRWRHAQPRAAHDDAPRPVPRHLGSGGDQRGGLPGGGHHGSAVRRLAAVLP